MSIKQGHSLLGAADLAPADVEALLDRADELRAGALPHRRDAVLGLFFFQPSVRTHFGFRVAMSRLGGTAVDVPEPYHRQEMSGEERAEDVIRAVASYCDAIVIRHERPEVLHCAVAAGIPVINGGNGHREHPSQALIDLYAIRRHYGQLDSVRIAMVGDLCCSRAAHSLLLLLRNTNVAEIRLCCPSSRRPADEWLSREAPVTLAKDGLDLSGIDVVYVAGFPPLCQDDRIDDEERGQYRITAPALAQAREDAIVLCPLPNIDEIAQSAVSAPQSRLFQQSREGIFVRQALLEWLFDLQVT